MADVVDNDVLEAVRKLWQEGDQATLPALFNEPPKTGRLKSPQTMPYARLDCNPERRESAGTGGKWHDFRRVEIFVYGVKADVVRALGAIGEIFNQQCTLTFPSGARFIRWWPEPGGDLSQDEDTKDGQDVWKGVANGIVWSVRQG